MFLVLLCLFTRVPACFSAKNLCCKLKKVKSTPTLFFIYPKTKVFVTQQVVGVDNGQKTIDTFDLKHYFASRTGVDVSRFSLCVVTSLRNKKLSRRGSTICSNFLRFARKFSCCETTWCARRKTRTFDLKLATKPQMLCTKLRVFVAHFTQTLSNNNNVNHIFR